MFDSFLGKNGILKFVEYFTHRMYLLTKYKIWVTRQTLYLQNSYPPKAVTYSTSDIAILLLVSIINIEN